VQRRERVRSEQRETQLRAEAAEAQARAAEAEARVVRQESRRKTAELEAARDLQLSMLPEALPEHPRLRIAASMTTATEVGGDYYDFNLCPDGSLLAALGDASGHGLRAGMVVMTAKSLFVSLPEDSDLANALRQGNRILRRMHLGRLNMALALARVTEGRIETVSAGVPPPLLYCSRDGTVKELGEGGVPLGGMPQPTYRQTTRPFAAGDMVLMMSDGFPELRNPAGEQLGYERAREAFRTAAAQRNPEVIITALQSIAETWSGGSPGDDDMTFVVIRCEH
jgi:serine phosphatase RsbU (regulator of sigma subunit)